LYSLRPRLEPATLKPNPAGPTRRLDRPEIRKSFNGARARAAVRLSTARTRTAALVAAAAAGGGWMGCREKGGVDAGARVLT